MKLDDEFRGGTWERKKLAEKASALWWWEVVDEKKIQDDFIGADVKVND